MIKNFIIISWRNLLRHKLSSVINISGLALGIGCCILILLWVKDELSYDRFHKNSGEIYRLSREWYNDKGESSLHLAQVAPPIAPLLKNDFEGIVLKAARVLPAYQPLVTLEEKTFPNQNVFFADEDIVDIFSFNYSEGDPSTALKEPNAAIITTTTAKRYFGEEDAAGKIIYLGIDRDPLKISAVVEPFPSNSHWHFDMIVSFGYIENTLGQEALMTGWGRNMYSTYILLPEGYDPHRLEAELPDFLDRHMGQHYGGVKVSSSTSLFLWPLEDIHLHSHLEAELEPNGDINHVYIYSVIALFIMTIACINFMNLSTANASDRAKEVGMRKAMGASKKLLVKQFLGETIILTLFSFLLALLAVLLFLPWFNNFTQKDLSINFIENPELLLGGILLVLLVGISAGSYPAFYLSSFEPVKVLKGRILSVKGGKATLRSALVIFQFVISIALIGSMGVINDQINFLQTKDLGFKKDNLIVVPSSTFINDNYERVMDQLLQHDGIIDVAASSIVPSGRLLDDWGAVAEVDGNMTPTGSRIAGVQVDFSFVETYGLELIAGRDFNPALASDSLEAFIINESAVKAIGWENPKDAIDKGFKYGNRSGRITGVVKDFHFESLHQPISPIVFLIGERASGNITIKYNNDQSDAVMAFLKKQWEEEYRQGYPFSPALIEDSFNQQYEKEDRISKIFSYFSIVAIIIASLGLLGLSAYTVEKRTKEIGIRKVLGANIGSIIASFITRFSVLVLIAFVIASPLIYLMMDYWLNTFAFHAGINFWIIFAAGFTAIIIATLTISFHAYNAATSNPVESLKSE